VIYVSLLARTTLTEDVLLDHFQRCATRREDGVRSRPQHGLPVELPEVLSMVTAQQATRYRLEIIDELGRFDGRWRVKQQMHMVSFTGKLQQETAPFFAQVGQDASEVLQHGNVDTLPAVFRDQHQVVLKAVHPVRTGLDLLHT
jgi:hypothetical protein